MKYSSSRQALGSDFCQLHLDGGGVYIGQTTGGKPSNLGYLRVNGYHFYGEFKNGSPSGIGKSYSNHTIRRGIFEGRKLEGFGEILKISTGSTITGEFLNNQLQGFGIIISPQKQYCYFGGFNNGQMQGLGKEIIDGEEFVGTFENGSRSGFGILRRKNGTITGFWLDNNLSQFGEEKHQSGEYYLGDFFNGQKHGLATQKIDEERFYGVFNSGVRSGLGELKSSRYSYLGQWQDNLQNGTGYELLMFENNQDEAYFGNWVNGRKEGLGINFKEDHTYIGEWKDDYPHGIAVIVDKKSQRIGILSEQGNITGRIDISKASKAVRSISSVNIDAYLQDCNSKISKIKENIAEKKSSLEFHKAQFKDNIEEQIKVIDSKISDVKSKADTIEEIVRTWASSEDLSTLEAESPIPVLPSSSFISFRSNSPSRRLLKELDSRSFAISPSLTPPTSMPLLASPPPSSPPPTRPSSPDNESLLRQLSALKAERSALESRVEEMKKFRKEKKMLEKQLEENNKVREKEEALQMKALKKRSKLIEFEEESINKQELQHHKSMLKILEKETEIQERLKMVNAYEVVTNAVIGLLDKERAQVFNEEEVEEMKRVREELRSALEEKRKEKQQFIEIIAKKIEAIDEHIKMKEEIKIIDPNTPLQFLMSFSILKKEEEKLKEERNALGAIFEEHEKKYSELISAQADQDYKIKSIKQQHTSLEEELKFLKTEKTDKMDQIINIEQKIANLDDSLEELEFSGVEGVVSMIKSRVDIDIQGNSNIAMNDNLQAKDQVGSINKNNASEGRKSEKSIDSHRNNLQRNEETAKDREGTNNPELLTKIENNEGELVKSEIIHDTQDIIKIKHIEEAQSEINIQKENRIASSPKADKVERDNTLMSITETDIQQDSIKTTDSEIQQDSVGATDKQEIKSDLEYKSQQDTLRIEMNTEDAQGLNEDKLLESTYSTEMRSPNIQEMQSNGKQLQILNAVITDPSNSIQSINDVEDAIPGSSNDSIQQQNESLKAQLRALKDKLESQTELMNENERIIEKLGVENRSIKSEIELLESNAAKLAESSLRNNKSELIEMLKKEIDFTTQQITSTIATTSSTSSQISSISASSLSPLIRSLSPLLLTLCLPLHVKPSIQEPLELPVGHLGLLLLSSGESQGPMLSNSEIEDIEDERRKYVAEEEKLKVIVENIQSQDDQQHDQQHDQQNDQQTREAKILEIESGELEEQARRLEQEVSLIEEQVRQQLARRMGDGEGERRSSDFGHVVLNKLKFTSQAKLRENSRQKAMIDRAFFAKKKLKIDVIKLNSTANIEITKDGDRIIAYGQSGMQVINVMGNEFFVEKSIQNTHIISLKTIDQDRFIAHNLKANRIEVYNSKYEVIKTYPSNINLTQGMMSCSRFTGDDKYSIWLSSSSSLLKINNESLEFEIIADFWIFTTRSRILRPFLILCNRPANKFFGIGLDKGNISILIYLEKDKKKEIQPKMFESHIQEWETIELSYSEKIIYVGGSVNKIGVIGVIVFNETLKPLDFLKLASLNLESVSKIKRIEGTDILLVGSFCIIFIAIFSTSEKKFSVIDVIKGLTPGENIHSLFFYSDKLFFCGESGKNLGVIEFEHFVEMHDFYAKENKWVGEARSTFAQTIFNSIGLSSNEHRTIFEKKGDIRKILSKAVNKQAFPDKIFYRCEIKTREDHVSLIISGPDGTYSAIIDENLNELKELKLLDENYSYSINTTKESIILGQIVENISNLKILGSSIKKIEGKELVLGKERSIELTTKENCKFEKYFPWISDSYDLSLIHLQNHKRTFLNNFWVVSGEESSVTPLKPISVFNLQVLDIVVGIAVDNSENFWLQRAFISEGRRLSFNLNTYFGNPSLKIKAIGESNIDSLVILCTLYQKKIDSPSALIYALDLNSDQIKQRFTYKIDSFSEKAKLSVRIYGTSKQEHIMIADLNKIHIILHDNTTFEKICSIKNLYSGQVYDMCAHNNLLFCVGEKNGVTLIEVPSDKGSPSKGILEQSTISEITKLVLTESLPDSTKKKHFAFFTTKKIETQASLKIKKLAYSPNSNKMYALGTSMIIMQENQNNEIEISDPVDCPSIMWIKILADDVIAYQDAVTGDLVFANSDFKIIKRLEGKPCSSPIFEAVRHFNFTFDDHYLIWAKGNNNICIVDIMNREEFMEVQNFFGRQSEIVPLRASGNKDASVFIGLSSTKNGTQYICYYDNKNKSILRKVTEFSNEIKVAMDLEMSVTEKNFFLGGSTELNDEGIASISAYSLNKSMKLISNMKLHGPYDYSVNRIRTVKKSRNMIISTSCSIYVLSFKNRDFKILSSIKDIHSGTEPISDAIFFSDQILTASQSDNHLTLIKFNKF